MTPASLRNAALIVLVTAAVGWVALDTWTGRGGVSPPLPWTAVAGIAALAVAVVAAGLPVRRWTRGRREKPLDPMVAARTVVLAKSASIGGALLAGWYLAQALELVPDLVGQRRARFVLALFAALAAAAVVAAGHLVQHWCRVPPDDSGPGAPGSRHGGRVRE